MHHAPVRIPICVVVGFFCPVPAGESISKVHNLPNQNVEPDAIKRAQRIKGMKLFRKNLVS